MTYSQKITVAMISFNDEKIIGDCFRSIRNQDYDQELIKIIIVDGGSTDNTLEIAKKFKVHIISRPDLMNEPDVRAAIALTYSKTPLVLFFSADNRLMESDLLTKMTLAMEDPQCIAVETLRYGFNPADPIFSRYCALIGGADPIAVGLGKADRGPHDRSGWHGSGSISVDRGTIYVDFPKKISTIPTLGANGCLIRANLIRDSKYSANGLHIDMLADLIMNGKSRVAFISEGHINHFLNIGVLDFIRRRIRYALMYGGAKKNRYYNVFTYEDLPKLCFLILANLTLVIPILRSIRGFALKPDLAWFLHPVIALIFTFSYTVMVVMGFINKIKLQTRVKFNGK